MGTLSGKFVLRVSSELHKELRAAASTQHISLNQLCVGLLESGLTRNTQSHFHMAADSAVNQIVAETMSVIGTLNFPLLGAALFGSFARGRQHQNSDIDLLLVLDKKVALSRELYTNWDKLAAASKTKLGNLVSPHFVHLPEEARDAGGIWLETALEGIVLWDKDFTLNRFLAELRLYILENNIRSKMLHGHRYWIKQKEAA